MFSVSVVDFTGSTVNFRGDKGGLTVDAGEFSHLLGNGP